MAGFAPNLYHQFLQLSARRFAAAAKLVFDAVEWHFPYELPKTNSNRCSTAQRDVHLRRRAGGLAQQKIGSGGQPGLQEQFRRAADTALDYALHVPYRGSMSVMEGCRKAWSGNAASKPM